MDAPGHSPRVIAENLVDLRRVNWLLGGIRLTWHSLQRLLASVSTGSPVRVLDVASGAADIPAAVAQRLRSGGHSPFVVASDINEDILRAARAHNSAATGMVYLAADATRLPFTDGAFDAVTCSLALHHMLPGEAIAMLAEMRRCAARGIVVNDIVRSWLTYYGAIIATRLGSRNALTLHDGPLSARRAFTTAEMQQLARSAGLKASHWDSFLFYRVAMTAT